MDLPINVDVFCQGENCGHATAVVLNPITDVVTHLVVKEERSPNTERLVPIKLIDKSTPQAVYLRCNTDMLQDLSPFIDVEYIQSVIPHYSAVYGNYYIQPLVTNDREIVAVPHQHIPADELSISRGAKVFSSDRHQIGNVDEFMVDEENGHITHLILREGHLWGKKDVSIPVSEIDQIDGEHVHLKIDKKKVGELPVIPVKRKWA